MNWVFSPRMQCSFSSLHKCSNGFFFFSPQMFEYSWIFSLHGQYPEWHSSVTNFQFALEILCQPNGQHWIYHTTLRCKWALIIVHIFVSVWSHDPQTNVLFFLVSSTKHSNICFSSGKQQGHPRQTVLDLIALSSLLTVFKFVQNWPLLTFLIQANTVGQRWPYLLSLLKALVLVGGKKMSELVRGPSILRFWEDRNILAWVLLLFCPSVPLVVQKDQQYRRASRSFCTGGPSLLWHRPESPTSMSINTLETLLHLELS